MPCLTAFSAMGCLHFLHFPLPVKACSTLGDSLLFSVLILVYILYFKKACLASEFDTAKKEGEKSKLPSTFIINKANPYLNQKHHAIHNTKTL